MEELFSRMGLSSNGPKTKVLTNIPPIPTTNISTAAYK